MYSKGSVFMNKFILTIFVMFIGIMFVYADSDVSLLEMISVTSNSVTLRVVTENKDDTCYLYRSNDNINYEKTMIIDCNKMYVDGELDSGVTYYYKARLETSDEYSEVLSITTTSSNNVDVGVKSLKRDIVTVTNAGMSFYVGIFAMMVMVVITMFVIKRKLS